VIQDKELEREVMDRAQLELTRATQSLANSLEEANKNLRELMADQRRLEGERSSLLRQLDDAKRNVRRDLQLIQDLEHEIRHRSKDRSDSGLALGAQGDVTPMNLMWDTVASSPNSSGPSFAVYNADIAHDASTHASASSSKESGDRLEDSTPGRAMLLLTKDDVSLIITSIDRSTKANGQSLVEDAITQQLSKLSRR
jgi:hypothetical protein